MISLRSYIYILHLKLAFHEVFQNLGFSHKKAALCNFSTLLLMMEILVGKRNALSCLIIYLYHLKSDTSTAKIKLIRGVLS